MTNYTLETEAKTLERMGEMISHLSEDYGKVSAKYLQLLEKTEQLEKKLEIATRALKDCYNDMKYWAVLTRRNQRIVNVIKKALKEMEGVK